MRPVDVGVGQEAIEVALVPLNLGVNIRPASSRIGAASFADTATGHTRPLQCSGFFVKVGMGPRF